MKRDDIGEPVSNGDAETKQSGTVFLTPTAWRWLDQLAQHHHLSPSEVIERLVCSLETQQTPSVALGNDASPAQLDQQRLAIAPLQPPLNLESLLDATSDAIARFNQDLQWSYVNHATEQQIGLSRSELLGKTVAALPTEARALCFWADSLTSVMVSAQPQIVEAEIAAVDQARFYQARLIPEVNTSGNAVSVIVISRDITAYQQSMGDRQRAERERQQTEASLRRSAERARQLQRVTAALAEASTPQQVAKAVVERGIAALGARASAVVLVTEQDKQLVILDAVGYPPLYLEGLNRLPIQAPVALAATVCSGKPSFLESPDDILKHFPTMAETLAQLASQAIATIPLIVSGHTLGGIEISFAESQPFSEDDRTFILTLAQQCAQAIARAQLYETEQQARASAEAANRAKDEFLAVLSHELRTPLNPILGWTQLLLQNRLDAHAATLALQTIERNAKLQVELIEDLLDISRILQGKLSLTSSPVHMLTTLEAAIATIQLAADAKAIQLHTHVSSSALTVLGDSGRLQQVLWNVLSNAVKFTPKQGQINIDLKSDGENITIQIQDNGQGIRADFLPHVFDYFRQADSSITRTFGGLGLGLAIARHIIELHGGIMYAESLGEHHGSTFTITLPLWNAPPTPPPAAEICSSAEVRLDGLCVLVVDDEVDNLDLVTFILKQSGATVAAVTSAAEGLKQFQQQQPHIVLIDIGMPEVDGYQLLRQIHQLPNQLETTTPAIALTAYASQADQVQAIAAGFQQHLAKPVEPDELLEAIRSLVCD